LLISLYSSEKAADMDSYSLLRELYSEVAVDTELLIDVLMESLSAAESLSETRALADADSLPAALALSDSE
jgi:hypothetical protein